MLSQLFPVSLRVIGIGTGAVDVKRYSCQGGHQNITIARRSCRPSETRLEIRLIHAKAPGPAFSEDFDRYTILKTARERILCPRVHFKMIIFDSVTAYIGSVNLTGAGIVMKSINRRNFETGILTDDPALVEAPSEQFDSVWRGEHCTRCGRQYCSDPIK